MEQSKSFRAGIFKTGFLCTFWCSIGILLWPQVAFAIPSPELVIGSVSSLSQVLAVGFAFVSGAAALLARKFGINYSPKSGNSRLSMRAVLLMIALISALGYGNFIQYKQAKTQELERMQSTLVRPAQFKGTTIKDATLKETSFSKQKNSTLSITTAQAAAMLRIKGTSGPVFFDVRETGEHAMGSLPGATHVRFPDFMQNPPDLKGRQVVLFCHNGNRSSETCADLAARGIDCKFIAGGIEKWIVEGRDFSDHSVKGLSDLRALPQYSNRDTLLTSKDFSALMETGDLQIVDTRYPGDFAAGHLPGAINIPVRALPSSELATRVAALEDKPIVAACYDRRSCFMSQVLGLELAQSGLDFRGRYTTPWDYFVAPPAKPHVEAWLAAQNTSMWQKAIAGLSALLIWLAGHSGIVLAVLTLAIVSRILILPIAVKSERDQIATALHGDALAALKSDLAEDPTRKARAIQQFYARHGLTPMRNLTALLFLPLMMLGLSATEQAGKTLAQPLGWVANIGAPDPTYALPFIFALLAGVYMHWAVAKTPRQAMLWWVIGAPVLFGLVFQLSALGNIYLCFALSLLLMQRAYVTGMLAQFRNKMRKWVRDMAVQHRYQGVIPLVHNAALSGAGNKSYRLSVMRNAGLPVPNGAVVPTSVIARYETLTAAQKADFTDMIWRMIGQQPCAVRSSAAGEDGADKSFAGIFDSVLHVERDTLQEALETVMASFSSGRAEIYAAGQSQANDGNILVQEMVDAEYAGVMFTQDPTAPGLMMIELAKGTGDDLVSGRVTPENFRFGRYSKLLVGPKKPPFGLAPLIRFAIQIEALFEGPQDIEWAFKDGQFYILQSRDITTLQVSDTTQQACLDEWQRVFDTFKDAPKLGIILEQDEMSEVLPRPTPVSFDLMGRMWAPGGSLDLACRDLGVSYNVVEGKAGHLFTLFGKTYVDKQIKDAMALNLSASKAKGLRKVARRMPRLFREQTMPELHQFLAPWKATDFDKMPLDALRVCLEMFREKLTQDTYVEAEKINILAGFTMAEAEAFVTEHPDQQSRLRHAEMEHSPTGLVRSCGRLRGKARKRAALALMGHRAIFDYELSTPRYAEAPELLSPMLKSVRDMPKPAVVRDSFDDPISLALSLQNLKEQAKHEALWLVFLIRKVLLAIAEYEQFGDLVFHLTLDEVAALGTETREALMRQAEERKARAAMLRGFGPKAVELSLQECEILSAPDLLAQAFGDGEMGGKCVSGSVGASGQVFVVDETTDDVDVAFEGFQSGDVIVCHMVNPEWLPQIQKSAAVLSEVGGWLSHMSIVAREHNLLMLVACKGVHNLKTGDHVTVTPQGEIERINEAGAEMDLAS